MTLDTNSLDGDLSISEIELETMSQNHKSSSTSFRMDSEKDIIGKRETRKVRYTKGIVIFILSLLAVTVSLIIFYNVRTTERQSFRTDFKDNGQRIIKTFHSNLQHRKDVLNNFAIHVTSWAEAMKTVASGATNTSQSSWPFVTVPNFDLRGGSTRHMGSALMGLTLIPIVQEEDRIAYEAYTVQNQEWIQIGLQHQIALEAVGNDDGDDSDDVGHNGDTNVGSSVPNGALMERVAPTIPSSTADPDNRIRKRNLQTQQEQRARDDVNNKDENTITDEREGEELSSNSTTPSLTPIISNSSLTPPGEENQVPNTSIPTPTTLPEANQASTQSPSTTNIASTPSNTSSSSSAATIPPSVNTTLTPSSSFPPFIYKVDTTTDTPIPVSSPGPYFPIRQMSPILPELVNFNTASLSTNNDDEEKLVQSTFGEGILETYRSKQVVIGKIVTRQHDDDDDEDTTNPETSSSSTTRSSSSSSLDHDINYDSMVQRLLPSHFPIDEPFSSVHFPIFDHNDYYYYPRTGEEGEELAMVGMFTTFMAWTALLSDILSPDAIGYVVVLENACDQKCTFILDGPHARVYYGEDVGSRNDAGVRNDPHDRKYDSMKQSYNFELETDRNTADEGKNDQDLYKMSTKPDWNYQYCPYTLHVYPSSELEKSYLSNQPIIYTLAVVLVYFLATVVFLIYDCVVERRQRVILQVALESRAIVSSLFPAVVRDRLFEQRRKVTGKVRNMIQNMGGSNHSGSRDDGGSGSGGTKRPSGGHSIRIPSGSSDANTSGGGSGSTRIVSFRLSRLGSSRGTRDSSELDGGDLTNYDDTTGRGGDDDPMTSYLPTSHRNHSEGTLSHRASIQSMHQSTLRLKSYLSVSSKGDDSSSDFKPIADMFPHTTVLFADIAGFTSWSSQRDPEQVFTLLQSIFKAFDRAARKRRVFKVETIGDCYVAVTGLPDPQEDHAWRMCKFALECRSKMTEVTRDLEVKLGPDTGDLVCRFGIHSGAVTAGVLRGEKSRFQLFGDTVNTAARMESTGVRCRIQISQSTADRLKATGKGAWIRPREDLVEAKGKGVIKTYWLASRPNATAKKARRSSLEKTNEVFLSRRSQFQNRGGTSSSEGSVFTEDEDAFGRSSNTSTAFEIPAEALSEDRHRRRVINWQTELLIKSLKLIVARRSQTLEVDIDNITISRMKGSIVLDEVVESIALPQFDEDAFQFQRDPHSVLLSLSVVSQLHDYVSTVAGMYKDNAFHNFEHASHVTASASKFLHRFIDPECEDVEVAKELHEITDGINSDPLTQFAVVFSALVHDVDHQGVPNASLAKEDPQMAELYRNRSIAEQKSVDIAFDLLMDPSYSDLRACIYSNQQELDRFRQLVVNCVMATDIFDEEMKVSRDARWEKLFPENMLVCPPPAPSPSQSRNKSLTNPRATLIIEHILQASDIAHTMQHWHVYNKWNECLFKEMYDAFQAGRSEKNPADYWYEGELGFFDNYVIPLARKLQACEVFGVSSNECLSYAMDNRDEWAVKGRTIVAELVAKYRPKEDSEKESDTEIAA